MCMLNPPLIDSRNTLVQIVIFTTTVSLSFIVYFLDFNSSASALRSGTLRVTKDKVVVCNLFNKCIIVEKAERHFHIVSRCLKYKQFHINSIVVSNIFKIHDLLCMQVGVVYVKDK